MTRTKNSAQTRINPDELRRLLAQDRDLLKVIVEQTVQQVHDPNTIDTLHFTLRRAFSCPMRARPQRRTSS